MKKLAVIPLFVSVIAVLQGVSWAQYQRPNVSYEAAGKLAQLARNAMSEYLASRTTPEKYPIPDDLSIFDSSSYENTVFLTLRIDGMKLSSASCSGLGLARNTVGAALKAMRGSSLGDNVNQESLVRLDVEVEILGQPEVVPEQEVTAKLIPGLLGLRFWSGIDDPKLIGLLKTGNIDITVLPSEAYREGWSPTMIKEKILEILSRMDVSLLPDTTPKWQMFSTLHFMNPAGTKECYIYYRGKILRVYPGEKYFLVTLLNALAKNFDFKTNEVKNPNGTSEPLWQELYLACSLRKIAGKSSGKIRKLAGDVADSILSGVAEKRVRFDHKLNIAYIMAEPVDDEVLSTAMLSLAIAGDKSKPEIIELSAAVRNFLFTRVDKEGAMTDSRERKITNMAFAVALRAMAKEKMSADETTVFCNALDSLLARAGEMGNVIKHGDALGLTESAWLVEAIIAAGPNMQTQYLTFLKRFTKRLIDAQPEFTQLLDENGALINSRGQADTLATATAICAFTEMQGVARWAGSVAACRKALDFCWMMTYRPNEAYFAGDPAKWPGTVRMIPSAARTSLADSAAVLDALASMMAPETPAAETTVSKAPSPKAPAVKTTPAAATPSTKPADK